VREELPAHCPRRIRTSTNGSKDPSGNPPWTPVSRNLQAFRSAESYFEAPERGLRSIQTVAETVAATDGTEPLKRRGKFLLRHAHQLDWRRAIHACPWQEHHLARGLREQVPRAHLLGGLPAFALRDPARDGAQNFAQGKEMTDRRTSTCRRSNHRPLPPCGVSTSPIGPAWTYWEMDPRLKQGEGAKSVHALTAAS